MGMRVDLVQYSDESMITVTGADGRFRRIHYAQPSHRYRSSADYSTLVTEYRTYGDRALEDTFAYLANARRAVTA